MKRYTKISKICFMMVLCFAFMTSSVLANNANTRTISVSGFAQRQVTPDTAHITVGVVTQSETVEAARAENARFVSQIVKRLTTYNIKEADVRTSSFQLHPVYSNITNQERVIVGYTVENYLTVRVKDVSNIGNVIDATFNAGANRFNGVNFTISNAQEIQEELLKEAVNDGLRKAKIVAGMSSFSVGNLLNATINTDNHQQLARGLTMMEAQAMDSSDNSQIFTGSVLLSASVDLTYELN